MFAVDLCDLRFGFRIVIVAIMPVLCPVPRLKGDRLAQFVGEPCFGLAQVFNFPQMINRNLAMLIEQKITIMFSVS